jgi:DNA-binding NtrC family response regulator
MTESSISVIVVDDEIELANLFKEYIQTCSLNAISFTDSLLALEYLKDNSKKFSLLMTDLRMPKM